MDVLNVKNIKLWKDSLYIGRNQKIWSINEEGSPLFGNPFAMKNESERVKVVNLYKGYLSFKAHDQKWLKSWKEKSNNKNIVCHCAPSQCHGHVLKAFNEGKIKAASINDANSFLKSCIEQGMSNDNKINGFFRDSLRNTCKIAKENGTLEKQGNSWIVDIKDESAANLMMSHAAKFIEENPNYQTLSNIFENIGKNIEIPKEKKNIDTFELRF